MLKNTLLFLLVLLVSVAAFVAVEREFSLAFQICLSTTDVGTVMNYLNCTGTFVNDNNSGITALATLLIAAFTGTLWITTSRQAQLTKEAFIANRRAFIVIPGLNQLWEQDPTTGLYSWRFRPILRNSGATPTKNMKMYVEGEVRNSVLPTGYSFFHKMTDMAGGTTAPYLELSGGLAPKMPGAPITPQDILDAQAGRKFIYIWGVIRYNDVFPRTRQHTTRYCFAITPTGDPRTFVPNTPGQPPTPGTMAFPYLLHSEGNIID